MLTSSASIELHDAFNTLVSTPNQLGLIATIRNEQIVPIETIFPTIRSNASSSSATTSVFERLDTLSASLSPTDAVYIILRDPTSCSSLPSSSTITTPTTTTSAPFTAITYVPDAAPVRQKTLVAATRLTLIRALGADRFGTTTFATDRSDVSAAGWRAHAAHAALPPPLTAAEEGLAGVREAEAEAGAAAGTGRRGAGEGARGLRMGIGEGVEDALRIVGREGGPNCVQLVSSVPRSQGSQDWGKLC